MSAVTKVLVEEDEVRSRLAELGLYSIEEIHAAFLESTQARSTCTGLDPVTLPGTYMSGVTVRALRRIGIPKGWKKKNQGGISLTVSPDKKLAVVVSTGTSGTGRKDGRPQTRSKKGKRMVDAISAAGFQYALIELLGPTAVKDPEPEIWVVLYRYRRVKDTDHKRVLIEISKPHPDGVNKRGRIVGWAERLVIPRLDIDGTPERKPEAGPQFDVSVVRRAT